MTDTPAPRPRSPLWMRLLLIASLALNLLVIAAVASAFFTRGDRGERLRGARDLAPPPFVLAIPREDRRDLLETMGREAAPFRLDRRETRTVLMQFLAGLRAETFDAAGARALLADERIRQQNRQSTGADLFVSYLDGLSPEDRRAYADRLEGILKRRARR